MGNRILPVTCELQDVLSCFKKTFSGIEHKHPLAVQGVDDRHPAHTNTSSFMDGMTDREQQYYDELYIDHFCRGEDISYDELKDKYPYTDQEDKLRTKRKEAEFIVKIKTRNNRSFQGDVLWVNKNVHRHFRSSLELVRLIQSTLDQL